ncbi:MAG: hypothetical protein AB7L09_14985 [Nitrospira sp.]
MSDLLRFSRFHALDTVLLYKLKPKGRWRPLQYSRVDQFTLREVCERYGTGRYLIRVQQGTKVSRLKCRITGGQVLRRRPWKVQWD